MARPIWKGQITFGLVNIPVTLFSAEKKADLRFKLLDSRDKAQVRYERVNEVTGEEVPWKEVVKAFEYAEGNYVVLDDEDFKRAAPEATKAVEIEGFVPEEAVHDLYFETPYYLVPTGKGDRAYVLLREALRKTGTIGVAKVVIRTRQYLAALMVHEEALVLNLLRFHQEVRQPSEFALPRGKPTEYKIAEREVDLAVQLIESMAVPWDPEQYRDEYREALMKWIEQKAHGEGLVTPPKEGEPEAVPAGEIVDFVEILKKSVAKQRKPEPVNGTPRKKASPSKRRAK